MKAILVRHPETFTAADFPCPPVTLQEGTYVADEGVDDDVASREPSFSTSTAREQDKARSEGASSSSSSSFSSSSMTSKGNETDDTSTSKGGDHQA